jgi:hypothetical protein
MAQLPREAREGFMRAWLEILRERQPGVIWVPAGERQREEVIQNTQPRKSARKMFD